MTIAAVIGNCDGWYEIEDFFRDEEAWLREHIHYAIASLIDVTTFANAMRRERGMENGLHYCLDVSFNGDRSRIRKDHALGNLTVVRHFALPALKQLPEPKRASIKR